MKKKFGQHFLTDSFVLQSILDALPDLSKKDVIEIGPGFGALTSLLLNNTSLKSLWAIDIDQDCIERIKQIEDKRLQAIQGDALKYDYSLCGDPPYFFIGNLPYNISVPLILKWIEDFKFEIFFVMVQKEVAQRFVASVGSKHYGRVSVMSSWRCDIKILFDIYPSAFTPPPKVDSCFLSFIPKNKSSKVSWKLLELLVKKAFSQRRKKIKNNLPELQNIMIKEGISADLRAQDITVQQYEKLAYLSNFNK